MTRMDEDLEEFVRQVYLGLLGREPDPESSRACVTALERRASPADLLREIVQSAEFQLLRRGMDENIYSYTDDARIARFRSEEVTALTRKLTTTERIARADYDGVWEETFRGDGYSPEMREYGEYHRERFWEMISALSVIVDGQESPRMLEFGISIFSHFYRSLGPHVRYFAADRPCSEGELEAAHGVCEKAGASGFFTTDLSDPEFLTDELREEMGQFDLIVFTEVLEHLVVHPVDVLAPIMELLAPEGTLYLTTPNFFSRGRLNQIVIRDNPQAVYPRSEQGNADFHHHHREFCMAELLEFIAEAGGRPTAFFFSTCWDPVPPVVVDQASNLVVTAQRA